jgi:hypothetical protein
VRDFLLGQLLACTSSASELHTKTPFLKFATESPKEINVTKIISNQILKITKVKVQPDNNNHTGDDYVDNNSDKDNNAW